VHLEQLGLIGNCQFSALVSASGEIVWCCLPRFDSEPVFARLLDGERGRRLRDRSGGRVGGHPALSGEHERPRDHVPRRDGAFRVIDFAPRFVLHERTFRPTQLVRIVEPLQGSPRIVVRCDPVLGWSRRAPGRLEGSNHLEFEGYQRPLRLTTDVPLGYLAGQPFVLNERRSSRSRGDRRSRRRWRHCASASWRRPSATGRAG
jgi:hypothetical protein